MDRFAIQRKIGLLFVGFCLVISGVNAVNFFGRHLGVEFLLANVLLLVVLAVVGLTVVFVDRPFMRGLMVVLFLLPAGPATLFANTPFMGMWMFIVAVTLILKLAPFGRWQLAAVGLSVVWYSPWLVLAVWQAPEGDANYSRIVDTILFLIVAAMTLYFLFEEEIRALASANKSKDATIDRQAHEIARLEPLSVLGERVGHVVHSFKNNLSQASTVLFYLEELHDEKRAAEKLREFAAAMDERIENILMVSRATLDLAAETFDAARVLEGLRYVYLNEPSFVRQAEAQLEVEGPVLLTAVRWDFILLVENVLKNAVEAISARGHAGHIRLTLAGGRLTIANDGGAMELCEPCGDSCLSCPRYGTVGQTNKAGGSGHGLAQVFATCRRNGWGLKIRTEGDWTLFEFTLTPR